MKPSYFDIGVVATTWNQDRKFGANKRYHHVRVIDVEGTQHTWLLTDQEREDVEHRAWVNPTDIPKPVTLWQRLWHNWFWDWLAR